MRIWGILLLVIELVGAGATVKHQPWILAIVGSLLCGTLLLQGIVPANSKEVSTKGVWNYTSSSASVAYLPEPRLEFGEKPVFKLSNGTILVNATEQVVVKTALTDFYLKPNSLALLTVDKGAERCEVFTGKVVLVHNKQYAELEEGRAAILSSKEFGTSMLLGNKSVGHRGVRLINLPSGVEVLTMDFAMHEALSSEPLLVKLMHSKNSHDKTLVQRVLKNATVINMVTNKRGTYSRTPE